MFIDVLKTSPNVPKVEIDPEKDSATLIMTGELLEFLKQLISLIKM